tara:strand:- start:2243 stop:2674 length:432 start_codon:yes stop_codon:yes gene_type:complete
MKDFSIIIGFLAIMAVACSPKEDDCEHDSNRATATDVEKGEDATTLTDKECYVKCVKTDMSELDCKKACYGDWAKEDKCKTCYEKCVKAGKSADDCKKGCCPTKPESDAGSNPKEADVETDAGVTVETDSGPDLPDDVSSTNG